MGFFRGFVAPFRGAVFVGRQRLWHLVLLPVTLNVALAGGAIWAAARYWRQELADRAVGSPALATLLFAGATGLGAIILFIVLQPLLGAVFNDFLAERVERRVLGDAPRAPFFASAARAIGHAILKLVLFTFAFVVGLALSAVTAGIGGVVGVGLGALFLAYDGFDYPLSRRSVGFGGKWRYLALHPGQTIGYGFGATIFYLIPLALVVAPPLTAVGATLAYLETESRREKHKKGKGRGDEASALRDGQG
ncbi:MAG: EI24 domain-containing protein [Deltaproteobacteria bacterium]|nr:EI24 domain-containing protein [Deltaproteobacteria bacterium]